MRDLRAFRVTWIAGILFAVMIASPPLHAQTGGSDTSRAVDSTYGFDSTWNADSAWAELGLDEEGFKFDEEVFGHVSTGWFPTPYLSWSLSYTTDAFYSDTYDRAMDLRSASLRPTTNPFGWCDPYQDSDERKIMQPYKDEENDDGYPVTNYDEHRLTFHFNPPVPLILRASAGLTITEGMLFSNDTTRSYLSLAGVVRDLREVSVVYLREYAIAGDIGVTIPFYGGFVKNEAIDLSSYYYIHAGIGGSYAVSSKATQFAQIANAKSDIRYGNGRDTVTLIDEQLLPNLNKTRYYYVGALGWNLVAEFFHLGFEVFTTIPITPVLDDADWKQYFVGARISLGYQWTPRKDENKPLWP